jgi:mannosyltransferase OCH1-like enzyme
MAQRIPKIIHQTWKTERIPRKWAPFVKKVRDLNPGWEYRLWTDSDNEAFVRKEFPEFYPVFRGFSREIMRADVIRYLIMLRIGGLYLDLDYEVLAPFEFGEAVLVLPLNRSMKYGDPMDELGNCIFASVPGHAFWEDVIADLASRPPQVTEYCQIYEATGPSFLTRIYHSHKERYTDITLPDRMLYHPPFPGSRKNRAKIRANGVSLGIHHPWGSWKERWTAAYLREKWEKILKP